MAHLPEQLAVHTNTVAENGTSKQHGEAYTPQRASPKGLGNWIKRVSLLLGTVGLLWAGGVSAVSMVTKPESASLLTHSVKRSDILVSLTENGDLESTEKTEVKCQVRGGSTILWVIEDGTPVKKGDLLVRLDSSTIDNDIQQQKITLEKARSTYITAQSELATAEVGIAEYEEGTFRKELQTIQSNIALAEETLRAAKNTARHAERMFQRGYVSRLEMESKQFAVEHANLELALRKTEEDVLKRFTKTKTLQELQSKVKAASAKMLSEKAAFELEQSKLAQLEQQKAYCTVNAPQDGLALRIQERWWSSEPEISVGAKVNESQPMIQLPDLAQMQAKVMVPESKIRQVKVGMPATVRVLNDVFPGQVTSVASQAKQEGWWAGNVKKFEAVVKLSGKHHLRPGMTAEVEIRIARHKDVLSLPVASIVEAQGETYCWISNGGNVERRSLVLGEGNDQFIAVGDGVSEGESVILNPRSVVAEAQEMLARIKDGDEDAATESIAAEADPDSRGGQEQKSKDAADPPDDDAAA